MKRIIRYVFFAAFFITAGILFSQNESKKWYFGANAGLDFMTGPPTILTNGAMNTSEGCASIANSAGNLLFYTDGMTVWDQTHAVMANGNGLFGVLTPCQSALIQKQPGSNTLYYIFTIAGISDPKGFNYSIVDMSLAAGLGSVTVKNAPLFPGPVYEKVTGTKHCNGVDYWIVAHQHNSANFLAYQLTPTGINTVAVTSSIGIAVGPPYSLGCMKISVTGKKLGMTDYAGYVDIFDFDNSTGLVTNWVPLLTGYSSYGCEFSPDGTKFYAGGFGNNGLRQWNLCAGSGTAIAASIYTITPATPWTLQLATDGKIYIAAGSSSLGVINNPNLSGAACNYTSFGQSIAPKSTFRGLPNFIAQAVVPPRPASQPYTFTVLCNSASFAGFAAGTQTINCAGYGYSLTNLAWNFGDPGSGAQNTSTLANPSHTFTSPGTYSTELVLYFSCTGGTDTLRQLVTISNSITSLAVAGKTTICSGEKSILTASGTTTYSWNTGASNATISVSPTVSTTYTVIGTTNGCSSTKTLQIAVNKCQGLKSAEHLSGLKIFPNPSPGNVTVEAETGGVLLMFDALGKIVFVANVSRGENNFDLSALLPGIYIVKIKYPESTGITRLIKTD